MAEARTGLVRTGRRRAGSLALAVTVVASGFLATQVPSATADAGASGPPGSSRASAPHARTWQGDAMRLDRVHRTATGKGVTIALLDGGIQPGVPALEGARIEMRKSPCSSATKHPVPVFEKDKYALHGSIMASLIVGGGAGAAGAGTGVMGVAPDATVRFYDVDDSTYPLVTGFNCGAQDLVRTALQAVRDGADVVSMSFTTRADEDSKGWLQVVEEADKRGTVLVASCLSTDDPAKILPPAGVPGIVSVNALNDRYFPWNKSVTLRDRSKGQPQSGWWTPAVTAPGVHIDVPGAALGYQDGAWETGTSGATALVAGAVALEKQKWPRATAAQLVQNLIHHTTRENITGGRKVPDMTWGTGTGFGAVSIVNILAHDPAGWPDENPLAIDPIKIKTVYPSSIYGKTAASSSASPSAKASPSSGGAKATPSPRATSAGASSGGVPAWVWGAVALVVLAAAAVVAALTRRRRTTTPPARPDGRDPQRDHDLTPTGGQ